MRSLFLLFSVLIAFKAQSQAPNIIWQKTVGCANIEIPYSFLIDNQGNYLIAGQSGDSCDLTGPILGYMDGWVIKLDSDGNKIWSTVLGGDSADAFYKIIQTSDNGYAIVGNTASAISGSVKKGGQDCWIAKLDVNGNLLWQKTFGSSSYDAAYDVAEANNGELMVVCLAGAGDGDVTNYKGGPADAWIIKLNSSGNFIWQKTYGSSQSDFAAAIKRTSDGDFIITGDAGTADGDITNIHSSDGHDVWVYKINDTGNIIWSKTYGGYMDQGGECIVQTKDSGYIVGAITNSDDMDVTNNYGGFDMWAVKLDDTGKIQWQKNYGGSQDDNFTSIVQSKNGGYLFVGTSSSNDNDATGNHGAYSDVLSIETDSTGNEVWAHMYGGSLGEAGASAYQLADSSYILCSITNSDDGDVAVNYGATNGWIFRLGEDSTTTSVQAVTGANSVKVYPTITDNIVNVHLPYNTDNTTLTLFDLTGRVVKVPVKRQQDEYRLSLQGKPAGMYLLKLLYRGQAQSYKIIYQP